MELTAFRSCLRSGIGRVQRGLSPLWRGVWGCPPEVFSSPPSPQGRRGNKGDEGRRGFTLAEVLIGLALTGLVVTGLAAAVFALIWLPGRPQYTLTAMRDIEQASLWLGWDGNRAEGFSPTPGYGTFSWVDRSGVAPVSYQANYSYSSGELVRQETKDGVPQSTLSIARNIAQASDIAFNWTATPSPYLRTAVTSSVESAGAQVAALSGELTASLRPRTDTSASVPPAAPGTRIYHVASGPVLETGTYVSGGTADLYWADSTYYSADRVVVVGERKVVWWVESEYISDPATISTGPTYIFSADEILFIASP